MVGRVILAVLFGPALCSAQQVVEIDYSAGRTIIDDELRGMRPHDLAVDWDRNIIYVNDAEEPNGIMVFSLETGEWIRTIATPRGDGPFEFSQGTGSLALASDGGLYVSGYRRVVTYDTNGEPVHTWTPNAPMRRAVCELDGKPAVPVPNGVLRHETEAIGPQAVTDGTVGVITSEQEGLDRSMLLARSRIACTDDRAFVVLTYSEGPDSVFVYHVNGDVNRVTVPTDFSEDWGCMIAGARLPAVDPESPTVVRPPGQPRPVRLRVAYRRCDHQSGDRVLRNRQEERADRHHPRPRANEGRQHLGIP